MITPLILGADGNMGRRYCAIMDFLGLPYYREDKDGIRHACPAHDKPFDGIVIATPTSLHVEHIRKYMPLGLPILCEKPITKDLAALEALLDEADERGVSIAMVDQYREMVIGHGVEPTRYDYFKSGGDGISWDTINIGAKARGSFTVGNTSPFWRCTINGISLRNSDMDAAYVDMLKNWLAAPRHDGAYIWRAHELAAKREASCTL